MMTTATFLSDWFILALASAWVFGMAGLFMKASQANNGSSPHLLIGLYTSASILFVLHATLTHQWIGLDWTWIVAGIIVGSGSAWGNDLFMRALNHGPASLTSPLSNMNVVFVVIGSSIWYHEALSAWQTAAICCLIAAVFLLTYKPANAASQIQSSPALPWKWFLLILACMLLFAIRNGGLKVTQELEFSNTAILAIAYLWSFSWFLPPVIRKNHDVSVKIRLAWLWGLAAGVCSYGGMQLFVYALENGQANIVAPIFATNSLVIALGSIWFFRERLGKWQWIAFGLLLCGLVWIRWS